jgi:hypothetical protein
LASGSWRSISRSIAPVLSATSAFSYLYMCRFSEHSHSGETYPLSVAKMTSSFVLRYSTVGNREPICRRRRWLKISETSLRACSLVLSVSCYPPNEREKEEGARTSKSKRQMLRTRSWRRSVA